jgi:hypothetical protein
MIACWQKACLCCRNLWNVRNEKPSNASPA